MVLKKPKVLAWALVLVGFAAAVVGIALYSLAAALIVGGGALAALGLTGVDVGAPKR